MRTIREVAQRAGVSVGTVSNVLSGAVPVSERLRHRVLQAIQELDYHPNHLARSLKVKQTQMIGMVIRNIADPVIPQMLRGAEDAAWFQNYLLVLLNSNEQPDREQQILRALRTRRVDGILLATDSTANRPHIRALSEAGTPVVSLEREIPGLDLDWVGADDAGGAMNCVRHLARQGRRSIGWIHPPAGDLAARERFEGYRRGLQEAGIEFQQALVAEAKSATGLFTRNPRPDAVLAADALLVPKLLRALSEHGLRAPDNVAIATFDEPRLCEALQVTTVLRPSYEIGFRAMELLIQRIQDAKRPRATVALPCSLQVPPLEDAR